MNYQVAGSISDSASYQNTLVLVIIIVIIIIYIFCYLAKLPDGQLMHALILDCFF